MFVTSLSGALAMALAGVGFAASDGSGPATGDPANVASGPLGDLLP